MKKTILLFLIVSIFGCSPQPSISPVEKVLVDTLNRIEIAAGYERHCKEKSKKLNANFYGNMQYVVMKLSEEILMRAPANASDEEKMAFVKSKLNPHTQKVRADIDASFQNEGCSSPKAIEAEKLYGLFTKLPPAQLHSIVKKQIQKTNAEK